MHYVYIAIILVVATVGFLAVPFGLPGIWLMTFGAAFLAWWTRDDPMFSATTLVVIFSIAIVAEAIEFAAGAAGARRAGGTRWGAWGGLIGGLAGAIVATPLIPVPILGTILGGCLGAFAGAAILEHVGGQETRAALRAGGGAAAGRAVGVITKVFLGAVIWVWVVVAAFAP